MKLFPSRLTRILPSLSFIAILAIAGFAPTEVLAKGGGGHGSSGHSSGSSSKSGGSSSKGSSSSSSYHSPAIVHTSHNTCVDQNTGQRVSCPKKSAVIAGIVIGSIVGFVLLCVLAWYIFFRWLPRRRERKRNLVRSTANQGIPPLDESSYQPIDEHASPEGAMPGQENTTAKFSQDKKQSLKEKISMPEPQPDPKGTVVLTPFGPTYDST